MSARAPQSKPVACAYCGKKAWEPLPEGWNLLGGKLACRACLVLASLVAA